MIPLKNNQIRNKKVIVIGTIFLDIKGYPEGKFDPSGRNAGRISYVHGGVGRNAAVDLAGLGCRPVFISMCEDDAFGKDIMANLKSCGLNTEYIINIPESTGLWMAVFDDNGDVYANISRRQDLRPLINVLEEHRDDLFSGTDAILIEMDANEELLEKTYEYASDYDIPVYGVISNMTIAKEHRQYIEKTKCFICNREEAGILFDADFAKDDPDAALEKLKYCFSISELNNIIVTLDKNGAIYAGQDRSFGYCPADKLNVIDSAGAGDAFFAGACAAMICGADLKSACETGNKTASKVLATTENVFMPADDNL